MSQPIKTAPKDGTIVILEDDKSGTYDVAHWSRKTYQWVGESGEPSKITPTHWYPKASDKYLLREDDRSPRRFAAWSIISTLTAAALIGVYFRAEVAGYVTRYAGLQDTFGIGRRQVAEQEAQLPSRDWRKFDLLALQQQAEADQGRDQAGVQVKQAGEVAAPEAQQSPKEERAEVLLREFTEARPAIEWLNVQLQAEAATRARSLEQEREKTTAFAQEAAAARLELIASTAQHRQALEEERARRAALWSELATAQREIETQAAQLRKASDETKQLEQATESAMVELRQSLQQERARTEAMARDIESARRTVGVRVTPEPAASSPTSKAVPAVEAVAMAQPAAAKVQSSPEATRLIARASALLGQGDIGAARVVLERAAETGSAQASFMLAETYDPGILSTWGTYGTRGEVTKARELYATAHAGGIQEAKDRFDALRR